MRRDDGAGRRVRRGAPAARRRAGWPASDDFGAEPFLEPLRVLLDSLRSAPLNDLGHDDPARHPAAQPRPAAAGRSTGATAHPEILDEPIDAPIVVVGMMRSGTTLLQRVLASDPRLACAYGWEVGEPAPRPGWDPAAADPRIADAEAREEQTRTFAAELFAIHPTYVHEAEEEIVFLADAFLSHIPEASCDVPRYRSWIDRQDFAPGLPLAAPDAPAAPVAEAAAGRAAAPVRAQDAGAPRLPRRRCWPSSPTPTSCTPTATRST